MATVATQIIAALARSGVRRVYGLPGDSLNGFTDAIRRSDDVTWEHVRHEETAAFAAAADAALTGQLAVCAGSCGPGNLHLINGLFDAQRIRVPVLAIAAHIPRSEIGSEYFQETHPQDLFARVQRLLRTGQHAGDGAAHHRDGDARRDRGERRRRRRRPRRDLPGARRRIRLAHQADRCPPDRWCDPTTRVCAARPTSSTPASASRSSAAPASQGAHDELVRLAGTLNAPVVHALRGKEFIEYDNPYDVGMTGLLGFASGYKAIKEADTLLMLGTDFPYQQFYPENARIVQVDVRGRNLGRRTPIDLGLVGTVADTRGGAAAAAGPEAVARAPRPVAAALRARRASRWTGWRSTIATRPRSARNTLRHWPIGWPPTTRCSPSTSARRWCGRRAT